MREIRKSQLAQVLSVSSLMDETYLERKLGEQVGEEVRASQLSLTVINLRCLLEYLISRSNQ